MFDRKVMHDDYLNIYSFSKGGKKITLVPLVPSQLYENKSQKNPEHSDLLLTCNEPLLKASYHEIKALKEWILVALDESESSAPNHPIYYL